MLFRSRPGRRREEAGVGRPARQRRRNPSRTLSPRRPPDLLTDQTSAHDPVNGYLPIGWSVADWVERRESDPESVAKAAKASMAVHVRSMLDFQAAGVPTTDYGNNIRQQIGRAHV